MYKWPKQTHPDGDNNWLICYLPLRWQMLDIFSFCLSYWERSCNYLFCKKSCPWHLGRLLSRLWMSWISFLSLLMLLHSCHSPEVVEKVSPPAPVPLPPSKESQDISPTQLAGESVQPWNVYLGCTTVLIHVLARKLPFCINTLILIHQKLESDI